MIINQYQAIFGGLPKEWMSPINKDKDGHPELDTSKNKLPVEGS
jgi:hypothetical protein